MSQIAVRLSEDELRRLDSVVEEDDFRTRAEAVRAAADGWTPPALAV